MASPERRRNYWKANLRIVGTLLAVWFAASYGAGILLADALDEIRLGGFKLGFWMAQQGSILVFLILVLVYAQWMNRLDRAHDVHED